MLSPGEDRERLCNALESQLSYPADLTLGINNRIALHWIELVIHYKLPITRMGYWDCSTGRLIPPRFHPAKVSKIPVC
jgi:hypothetical protein